MSSSTKRIVQEFVFGYGSLICPHSRAITAPTLKNTVTPVAVQNVERVWAKKSKSGMTAMGVRFQDDAECVGVLLPVNQQELKQFDHRELGYDRVPLYLGDVELVPDYDGPVHEAFWKAKQKQCAIQIWMYLPQTVTPPSDEAPIVQSYVDTILRGCLTISEDFAEQFIANTKGWTPNELLEDMNDDDDDNSEEGVLSGEEEASSMEDDDSSQEDTGSELSEDDVYWVNDRHNPIYSRGDQQYMLKHGHKLDSLLKRHREEFQYRSRHVPAAKE